MNLQLDNAFYFEGLRDTKYRCNVNCRVIAKPLYSQDISGVSRKTWIYTQLQIHAHGEIYSTFRII